MMKSFIYIHTCVCVYVCVWEGAILKLIDDNNYEIPATFNTWNNFNVYTLFYIMLFLHTLSYLNLHKKHPRNVCVFEFCKWGNWIWEKFYPASKRNRIWASGWILKLVWFLSHILLASSSVSLLYCTVGG